jgi:hypothetical protein
MDDVILHLNSLNEVFTCEDNFNEDDKIDFKLYKFNLEQLNDVFNSLSFVNTIYDEKDRQMILADFIEYIFFGRGYYSIKKKDDMGLFIKSLLYFVNLLMCYDMITVSTNTRNKILSKLSKNIPSINNEPLFNNLLSYQNKVGLPKSNAGQRLDNYFDSLLPKTAGGLWHELLVFSFLIRIDIGYIIPLLLTQRFMNVKRSIIPPDFFILTKDKHIYGVEVGTKKEIQSGAFSLQTAIPTATIDTINSRTSDRCPICGKWILLCPQVIKKYSSNLDEKILKKEIRCLDECEIYATEFIVRGICPYTKYSRNQARTLDHAQHKFADGLHYHYNCVLNNIDKESKEKIIKAEDNIALKTHYPYYYGLEGLII